MRERATEPLQLFIGGVQIQKILLSGNIGRARLVQTRL